MSLITNSGNNVVFNVNANGQVKINSRSGGAPLTINSSNGTEVFEVDNTGQVKIKSTNANAKLLTLIANNGTKILQVENNGLLRARRIKVDTDNWADYVFVNGYKLLSLQ
jgi:molybdopterin-guanine dinucleotide biosynthesis protein